VLHIAARQLDLALEVTKIAKPDVRPLPAHS
jgi:hypothetical protein